MDAEASAPFAERLVINMTLICVDDERWALQNTVSMCRELPRVKAVEGFTDSEKALEWLKTHDADIALLDINMPGINGIALAAWIRENRPNTAIVFLTATADYAYDAFELQASGYMLKPVRRERLAAEVAHALVRREHKEAGAKVEVRTFGDFEVLVDGKPVSFARAKARELLAYLVDRQGSSVTRAAVFAVLYEDALYDRSMQKQLDVVIRSLRESLAMVGIEDILEMKGGALRVRPERLDCDMYRLFSGDTDTIRACRGEYMNGYAWAGMNETPVTRIQRRVDES